MPVNVAMLDAWPADDTPSKNQTSRLDDEVSMAAPLPSREAVHPVDEVVALLDRATENARRHGRDDLVGRLDSERARVTRPTCHVLVVGEFKKGKSSLVNALLNARVCPADADRATAVPTFVRYGEEATAATIESDDGAGTSIPVADLESLATQFPGGPAARPGGGSVRSLAVTLPRRLLRDGMVLVDTPGVGGGLSAAHAAITLRALTGADVVLFVSDASQEYTAAELAFLRQAAELCPIVVCALTKTDFYPEWRRILELDQGHLRRAGIDRPIVALSAPLRHHGIRAGDRALVAESGYPWLAALLRRAAEESAGAALTAAVAAADSTLAQLVSLVSTEHEALADPLGRADRRVRWTEAKQQAERLKSAGARWQQVLSDRIADLASNVEHDLGIRLRGVRKEAVDRIGAGDPTRIWGELEPWLYRQTNEALLDHLRLIRTQADTIADEVAEQFGAAAWELQIAVEVGGSGAAARDARLAAVSADRSARLQLGLFAARGASVGAVVIHTVGLVLGLAMPATLPATALVAAVLARKSWRGAQQSQLKGLRAEAERAVTIYLDEVEQVARKDSRDSVRQIHRQLRDVFSQRAVELYTSTAQNLEALTRTLREDERSRSGRLEQTTGELDLLRAHSEQAEVLLERLLAR
ncbi:MAG TPA: dynamin family protein [Micromonosporaceae bacterium]|nr:dynamin family protein [Micromonosporaceae bacterium]